MTALGSQSIYFTTNILGHKPMRIQAMTNQAHSQSYQKETSIPTLIPFGPISTCNLYFCKEQTTKKRKHYPPGGKGVCRIQTSQSVFMPPVSFIYMLLDGEGGPHCNYYSFQKNTFQKENSVGIAISLCVTDTPAYVRASGAMFPAGCSDLKQVMITASSLLLGGHELRRNIRLLSSFRSTTVCQAKAEQMHTRGRISRDVPIQGRGAVIPIPSFLLLTHGGGMGFIQQEQRK